MLIPYTPHKKFDYDPKPAWGIRDGQAFFRCQCGILYELAEWDIDNQGNVSPSVHHVDEYCGFHEFIKLDEWEQYGGAL